MAQVCGECGASNADGDKFCRNCGNPLAGSVKLVTDKPSDGRGRNTGPWVALTLIGVLLLCCLSVIGIALLDELAPAHPLRAMLVGTPTATPTLSPTPTLIPMEAPISTPTPTYTPTPELGADSFEPDDTMDQANEIGIDGRPQTHTLSPSGDRDYVYFQAGEGLEYTIETGSLGNECDTVLTLYDEDGTELASDDDGADEPLASCLTWVADQDGALFVQVTHYDEEGDEEDTDYDIWVSESEPVTFEEDEYEPDDTMTQANEILLDVPQTHNIHVQGDHDWVFFQAEEGITYVIETTNLGGEIDTIIYLYDEDGEELAQDDDGGEETLASGITWSADATGTFYVMIQDYWDDEAGPDMEYQISVTEGVPFEADDYEPDDNRDQASEIGVGRHQIHNLHVTGDHDWISFLATEGTAYVIETFNLGNKIDTIIYLYDPDGQELASDDDGGDESLASRLVWTADEDGAFYVMVQDLGDAEAGPGTEYGISVREEEAALLSPDEYEPDDTMSEAQEIEVGEVQTHSIHVAGDNDWLSFQAVAGTTYLIETSNLGQEVDTIIFLYDEDGEELAQDDDGAEEPRASRITWVAEEDSALYVMMRDYKDNRAERDMGYEISIRGSENEPDLGEARVYIADGAYHIIAHENNEFVVGVSEWLSLENFTMEVDATQVSGDDDNEYGLVFAHQNDDDYYEVAVSGDGHAGFFAKEEEGWQSIVRFRPHEAITQANATNHLRLEVQEGRLSFYVNGELVFQDFDNRFSEGLIGFGCGPFKEPGLHCSFDNLSVWNEESSLVWEDEFDDNSGNWFETSMP
jgi:hypothetical protein